MRIHRQLLENAIEELKINQYVNVINFPSSGRISLLNQEKNNRFILHLLYSPPILRADKVQVIEDFVSLSETFVEFRIPKKVKKIYRVPDYKEIDFKYKNGIIKIKFLILKCIQLLYWNINQFFNFINMNSNNPLKSLDHWEDDLLREVS